ncbi:MAG: DinB family protein [Chloroflexota bacterium]
MPETPAFLSERLKSEGEKMAAFFAALTPGQWEIEVYTEGGLWSVRNVLAHFVTAERGFLALFEGIRAGGAGAPEDFSIDRYNASQQETTSDLPPGELLAQYTAVRAEMAAWVAGLSEADLMKEGRHPFLGQTILAEMVKMVYLHNQIHLRDLRKRVAGPPS